MNDGYVCFVQLIRVLCSFGSAERYERGAGALIVVRKAGCICFDPMYFYLTSGSLIGVPICVPIGVDACYACAGG